MVVFETLHLSKLISRKSDRQKNFKIHTEIYTKDHENVHSQISHLTLVKKRRNVKSHLSSIHANSNHDPSQVIPLYLVGNTAGLAIEIFQVAAAGSQQLMHW